jgi:hypothetical protein
VNVAVAYLGAGNRHWSEFFRGNVRARVQGAGRFQGDLPRLFSHGLIGGFQGTEHGHAPRTGVDRFGPPFDAVDEMVAFSC